MKTKKYTIICTIIALFSVIGVYGDTISVDEVVYNCIEQHSNGGYITDETPGVGAARILMAHPLSEYKFVEWVSSSGMKYADNPITLNLGANRMTTSMYAHFIKSNVFVETWEKDKIIIRSIDTDIFNTSGKAYANIYIDGERVGTNIVVNTLDLGYWYIQENNLLKNNKYAGKKIHTIFYDDCLQISGVLDTVIPYIVSDNCTVDTLNTPFKTNVHVLDNATLIINQDMVIGGVLDVHAGGKILIEEGKTLTLNGITLYGDALEKKWAQLIVNGSIINNDNNVINYDYKLDWKRWYPLAVPYDVICSNIRSCVHGGTAYFTIENYNTEKRAHGKSGFEVFPDTIEGVSLRAGDGYLIWAEPTKWNNKWQTAMPTIIRFPMTADLSEGENNKTINTNYVEYANCAQNKNWNLFGNPCLTNYTPKYKGNSINDNIVTLNNGNQAQDIADINYIVYSEDGFKSYKQDLMTNFTLLPFNSYFIQTEFDLPLAFLKSDRVRRMPKFTTEDTNNKEYRFGVIIKQNDNVDNTGLFYSDEYTTEYELNADLIKITGDSQKVSIYSFAYNDTKLAYQALPKHLIGQYQPIGFAFADIETATISFDDKRYNRSDFKAIWLNDIVTNIIVNLLDEPYTFIPQASNEDGRFYINAEVKNENQITTDNEIIQDKEIIHNIIYDIIGNKINYIENHGIYVLVDSKNNTMKIVK